MGIAVVTLRGHNEQIEPSLWRVSTPAVGFEHVWY